jgi:hypothetical protein
MGIGETVRKPPISFLRSTQDYVWIKHTKSVAGWTNRFISGGSRPVRRRVSKGVEVGGKPPALRAGHPRNSCKAVSGVVRSQSVEGLGNRARVTMMLLVNDSSRSVSCTIFHDQNDETCPKPLK